MSLWDVFVIGEKIGWAMISVSVMFTCMIFGDHFVVFPIFDSWTQESSFQI